MNQFKYKAVDPQGNQVDGKVEANSQVEAVSQLRSRSYQVLSVEEFSESLNVLQVLSKAKEIVSIKRYTSPGSADQILVFRQLALMLRAGNTLMQGLELCSEMTEKLQMKRALVNILVSIQGGSSFAVAIEREGRKFPPIVSKLVAAGEASGELQATLERLAESVARDAALKRQFVASMIYPMLVTVVAVGVTLFLAIGVVPKFAKMLEGKGQQLPPSTQLMIEVSNWLILNGMVLGIAVGSTVFLILAWYTTEKGKGVIDSILLYFPVVGSSIRSSGMAQMGWTMSSLLGSGLTVLESLRVVGSITENMRLSLCFSYASNQILAGRSLAAGLQQPQIPLMVQHMAGVGERSGELERVMKELGMYYQDLTEARIKKMISMIEPAMTLIIGGLVGFVYIAFFKAMMQVSAG